MSASKTKKEVASPKEMDLPAKLKEMLKNAQANGGADLSAMLSGAAAVEQPRHLVRKINALKNVQLEMVHVEAQFFNELHELECKFAKLYEPFYEKRHKIVTGEHEPTDDEAKWLLDESNSAAAAADKDGEVKDEDEKEKEKEKAKEADKEKENGADEKGIKNFWLETLQSFRVTAEIIHEADEPILAYLQDVRVKLFDKKPYGYTLEFHFAENPYFSNRVLTKTYELKTEVDAKDPFAFEGPDLDHATGCKIDWRAGKNVTVKLIKKKLKSKNKKAPPKIITKEEKQDSFFNFFETPAASKSKTAAGSGDDKQVAIRSKKHSTGDEADDLDDDDDEVDHEELYAIADFEIGQYLREKIVPKAVLYYTGEYDGMEEDDYDDEYEDGDEDDEDDDDDDEAGNGHDDDDDDDEDDDDDDEDDDDEAAKKGKKLLAGKPAAAGQKNGKPGQSKGGEPTPSECKQN